MGNYKITNISKSVDKRNSNYNTTIKLEYPENMIKKSVLIKPDQEIVMVISSLPQSFHQYKMNKLITIEEINEFQLYKLLNKPKIVSEPKIIEKVSTKSYKKQNN